jgi:hypothetical protein
VSIHTFAAWAALIGLTLLLDAWLVRWARRRWQVDEASPHVRAWGTYSPVLTWLKYRRLPLLKPRPPLLTSETAPGSAPAVDAAHSHPPLESVMPASEDTTLSATSSDDHADGPAASPHAVETDRPALAPAGPTRSAASWNLTLAIGASVLALVGQFFLAHISENWLDAAMFFVGAIGLLLILVWRAENQGDSVLAVWYRQAMARLRVVPTRVALVLSSVAVAYTTVRLMRAKVGDASYWDVFTLWIVSALCYAAAFVPRPRLSTFAPWLRRNQREVILVVALTAAAAALRFWQLGAIPDVVSGDEGIMGVTAMAVLRGEIQNILATVNNQGVLYMNLIASAIRLFGENALGLRFIAAAGGTVSVPLLYLLTRRMFNVRTAVLAASLLAVSHFHLHLSRVIVGSGIQDALFSILVFYLFLVGLEKRSIAYLTLSGLALGLFLYIYMGARLVVLLMPMYVAVLWFVDGKTVRANAGNLLAFVGALAVVAAPIASWALANPQEFMSRANQMGAIQSGWLANEAATTGKSQLLIFADLVRQAFLTVNYYPASVHYGSPYPMLDWVSGAAFMLGIAYSLYHIFDRRHLLLQAWFWSGIVVGGALVIVPSDNAYRIMIVFPAVCVFAALGVDRLLALAGQALLAARGAQFAPAAAFLAVVAVLNLKAYFVDFAPQCLYGDLATRFASNMGSKLGEVGPGYNAYLLGDQNVWYGVHKSVDYLSGFIPLTNVDLAADASGQPVYTDLDGNPVTFDPARKAIFFFIPQRAGELATIQRLMPGGRIERTYDCHLPILVIYRVDQPPSQ